LVEEEVPLDFEFMDLHPSLPGDVDDEGLLTLFEMMVSKIKGVEANTEIEMTK
jgi:hypothetical protein